MAAPTSRNDTQMQELREALLPSVERPSEDETASEGSDESKRTVDDVARFLSTLEPSLSEPPLTPRPERASSSSSRRPSLLQDDGGIPASPKVVLTVNSEIRDVAQLAAAYFVASVSWVAMKATDTALLGHVGTRYLDAAAYADLYTSSTGVFIQGQVLGVFCSQAFGAGNFALVGTWLKTSYCVLGAVSVPVIVAWALTAPALRAFGVRNASLRTNAGLYAGILATCVPARVGFSQLAQFFTSQRIIKPASVAAPVALLLNLIFGLLFVFGVPFREYFEGFGFVACPAVTSTVEFVQLFLVVSVFCSYYQLHAKCRPLNGWFDFRDVTRSRLWAYVELYAPAAIAAASDYWRLSAVGAVAASMLGKDDLGVFNASYRIMWISLTVAGSLGMAVGTNLGLRLGRGKSGDARFGVIVGLTLTLLVILALAGIVAAIPTYLGAIFTSDHELLRKFEEARYGIAATVFCMNLAVVLERIPTACGRTRVVLIAGAVASWFGQVPAVLVLITCWRKSLEALYYGVALGYFFLCCLLGGVIVRFDFEALASEAKLRSECEHSTPSPQDDDDDDSTTTARPRVVVVVQERDTSRNVHDHASFKPVRTNSSSHSSAGTSGKTKEDHGRRRAASSPSSSASTTRGFVRVHSSTSSSSPKRGLGPPLPEEGDLI